jgi:hypothetical protein
MADEVSPLAPVAIPPERVGNVYEAKMAPNMPGGRGPLRFEEGIATDTDVPGDFGVGISDGMVPDPGRDNHNRPVWYKHADEVMRERAHLGSAAWPEALTYVQSFAQGASPEAEQRFIQVNRGDADGLGGLDWRRRNAAQIID